MASSIDAITRMMNSFRHFEKKLDKLQDDVNYQGQTLLDLRVMVMNLSAGNIVSPDVKSEDGKRTRNNTAIIDHHEEKGKVNLTPPTTDRLSTQSGQKSLPQIRASLKRRLSSLEPPNPPMQNSVFKIDTSQIHMQRHKKAEATRKANRDRAHKKKLEKKKPVCA